MLCIAVKTRGCLHTYPSVAGWVIQVEVHKLLGSSIISHCHTFVLSFAILQPMLLLVNAIHFHGALHSVLLL